MKTILRFNLIHKKIIFVYCFEVNYSLYLLYKIHLLYLLKRATTTYLTSCGEIMVLGGQLLAPAHVILIGWNPSRGLTD